ncbi:MAG: hypothetical protein GTO45_14315 [Candidatus Aminicenantes bacterium]|nr:hypothetical protein [Candidatus Aminicenantes bacterium]NIM79940.1 hypothetical protein [Candidatus Aminicenantes bacterium]NIN19279.1 hypothetical protein [Candidatus Aminicenantes bacterium]NIN43182.1 hypothetical protein [Candidatus Aminicenantes bacterium]NIN85921.1 hypothetical protein [Candidatus Aminicenantes bacterium]
MEQARFTLSQHLLDITDISPALKHERGHAVAGQVTAPLFIDTGGLDILAYHLKLDLAPPLSLFLKSLPIKDCFNFCFLVKFIKDKMDPSVSEDVL